MQKKFQNFENCTTETRLQIENIADGVSQLLEKNLVGLYIHGSIVLDSFDENGSDLDIVVVINDELSLTDKFKLGSFLFSLNKKPCPLDVLFFIKGEIVPLKHQIKEHFYFSDYWSIQYEKISLGAENAEEILASVFSDGQPVSDFMVIKQKGICLLGEPINDIFPDIPNKLFLDVVSSRIDSFYVESENDSQSSFLVLQLCRMLSFKETGNILSKHKAAEWAFENIPSQHHPIIKTALYNKFGLGSKVMYTKEDAISFKTYMSQEIRQGKIND